MIFANEIPETGGLVKVCPGGKTTWFLISEVSHQTRKGAGYMTLTGMELGGESKGIETLFFGSMKDFYDRRVSGLFEYHAP